MAMAQMISDVPFPFPFAQFLQYALVGCFCIFVPIHVMGANLSSAWLSLLVNFLACACYAALNQISIELENPFLSFHIANGYPAYLEQRKVNKTMEECYFQKLPKDFDLSNLGVGSSLL